MIQKIKNNRTLYELYAGELFYGVICQIVIVVAGCFYEKMHEHPLYYSLGLWTGIILSGFLAWHMNRSISGALLCDEETAVKVVRKGSVARYIGVTLVLAGIMFTDVINPLTAFAGVMGLKISAYIEPFTYKVFDHVVGKEELPPLVDPVDLDAGIFNENINEK